MFCPDLRGGQYIWIFVAYFLLVVSKGFSEDDPHRKTYVVRYKNGDNTIPVTVVLDYKKQAEYVINMNPRTITKSVTFYDFKQKSIAYKDMTNRECFISHLTDETLQEENEILKELQNPVETNPLVLTLDPTRQSLTPTQIRNIAGQKIAMFCRKMATWHLQEGISQRRNRRQVELYSERKHDENRHQQHENSQNRHEVLRTGRNLTTGNSAHKRRKSNQIRRRNRNSASVNVVPKHQQNIFHRQAFYRNFHSENSQHIPNPNHGQVLLPSSRSNIQNIRNYTRELSNFQHGSNKKRPKFISSIHPRQGVNFQNFRNEHTQTPQLIADFNLPPGSSLYPRTPTVLQPPGYQPHTAEVNINHPLTFNDSSEGILDEWSHPLRIPNREHLLTTSSQKSAVHFDANINAIPQNIYSDFVQPLYKTRTEPNNNQWTVPLRYNSDSHKSESLINENELLHQVPTHQNKKLNLKTEPVRMNTLPANNLAYVQTNDIASRDNQSLYQFSLHNTNNNNGPNVQSNLYSNFKETENSRDENQHFGEYLKSNNSKNQEIFNNNTSNALQDEHFEELSKPVTSVEPLPYIPYTVESESSTVPNEFAEIDTDKKKPKKPDSPNVEDFILLNPSEFKEETNITFDQKTTPYHSNFSISLRERHPKPERLQNVLQLFTPDEIIIDVGKLPSPDRAGDEPRTTQNQYASTIHNDSTAQNLRTIQHQVNTSKQTLRPQQRSQHHVMRQNTLLNEISDRAPYVPYNNNLHSRGRIQKPQRFSPRLPPGFAMYPRHPQAPYADLASPDTKRTVLPAKLPIPQQQMSRHHQRHRRKKQRQLCCNRSPSSTEFSGCCTSRGTCCPRRHQGQVPTNCCQIPKPNNTKRRSDMLEAISEKAAADQQYQSVSDPKELCEKIKMCRTLYQSTQAVMVCRNAQVPGC